MTRRLSAFALSLAVLVGAPIQAQQSEDHSFLAQLRRLARRTRIVERLDGTIDGWYPRLGGMTRGSGFVIGPGHRTHIVGDEVRVDLSAALSTKLYKAADARVRWARPLHHRLELWTDVRLEDYPQEDYFGIGRHSTPDTRTTYDFSSRSADARVVVNIAPRAQAGTRVAVVSPSIDRGTDPEYPSIEQDFTDVQAPGLAAQPRYVESAVFVDIDRRDTPGNPRQGGLYHASLAYWNDTTLHQYNFTRFDVTALQYVPLTADHAHVISGRFGLSTLNNAPGDRVPFYFFPYVGGADTVRSVDEFRFQDENAIWAGVEYTWTPFGYVSFAAFVDTGKVAHGWDEVSFADMTQAYGVGVRIHTSKQRLMRLDLGTGGTDGWHAYVKLGPGW
jgi:outer membrane protein assembly factor BamA